MKTVKVLFIFFFSIPFLVSCADDIDDNIVSAPSDFYYLGELPIPFYTNGNTDFPSINWGNESGIFTLNDNYQGVSINSSTGVLSWNENLPLGSNSISVTATNSAGFAVTNVLFLHQFGGEFTGGYNSDPSSTTVPVSNLVIYFNVNGTLSITDNGETGTGTWSFNPQGALVCEYTVTSGSYELIYDLTYSVTVNPFLEGYKRLNGSTENLGFSRMDY
ncbi:hypothetical protein [Flavobacterium sp.]|uniref:hypothetical protein n=1 Tax=Flavobacterium sp. TaxID=239 RepID=UPI0025BB2BF2|nr:hypothetical protein [Flavobacterium sp.]MBA4153043.1 hypothetical protein [Flavobacterium sp.]